MPAAFQPGAFQRGAFQTQLVTNGAGTLPTLACAGEVFFGYYAAAAATLPSLVCAGDLAQPVVSEFAIDGVCVLPQLECDGDVSIPQVQRRGGGLSRPPLPDEFYFRKPQQQPTANVIRGACTLPALSGADWVEYATASGGTVLVRPADYSAAELAEILEIASLLDLAA